MATPNNQSSLIEAQCKTTETSLRQLDAMAAQGFPGEAAVLACAYLNGLARDCFASLDERDDMYLFTRLLRQHGRHSELFDRVSRVEITHRSAEDPFAPKTLHQHGIVTTAILAKFGNDADPNNDPTEAELLHLLSGIPRLNLETLRTNVWRYSYGAVLYRHWRNAGTHDAHPEPHTSEGINAETKPPKASGAQVWYDSRHRLVFSLDILTGTLRNVMMSLRDECANEGKTRPGRPSPVKPTAGEEV
jgi:hypothetical protein